MTIDQLNKRWTEKLSLILQKKKKSLNFINNNNFDNNKSYRKSAREAFSEILTQLNEYFKWNKQTNL